MQTLGFSEHNHAHCVDDAVRHAEEKCASLGLNLTPVRRKSLEILLEEHRALGAYELLERLVESGFKAQPPVAYRALEFLTANGFVHKVEKLNAFVACTHAEPGHAPVFLICEECDSVSEAPTTPLNTVWDETRATTGFDIRATVVEATGVCPNCQDGAA